ncbi:MAG: 2TM domain-containing protein [Rhodospirillales bacterium]
MTRRGGDGDIHVRRRLRGFALDLVAYFVATAALVAATLFLSAANPWVLAPLVGWCAVLAVHAAHAMGFLDVFRRNWGVRRDTAGG